MNVREIFALPVVGMSQAAEPAGVGDINSTAKGSGARYNSGKTPIELLPLWQIGTAYLQHGGLTVHQQDAAYALQYIGDYQSRRRGVEALYDAMAALGLELGFIECAQVFDYGRKKYAAWNWAKGMAWSVPIACAGRHCLEILRGESDDRESGKPHRGHIFCNLVMLISYAICYPEGDDRPAAGMIGAAPAANDSSAQATA